MVATGTCTVGKWAVRILMECCLVLVILTKSLLFIADPVIQNYLRIDEERIGDVRPGFPIYHKIAKILCIRCKVNSVNLRNVTNIYHLARLSNEMYFHVKSVVVDLRSFGYFDTINFIETEDVCQIMLFMCKYRHLEMEETVSWLRYTPYYSHNSNPPMAV